ncbi:Uncharacterized protein PBTT_03663 [Plasmodiophora brassicae]
MPPPRSAAIIMAAAVLAHAAVAILHDNDDSDVDAWDPGVVVDPRPARMASPMPGTADGRDSHRDGLPRHRSMDEVVGEDSTIFHNGDAASTCTSVSDVDLLSDIEFADEQREPDANGGEHLKGLGIELGAVSTYRSSSDMSDFPTLHSAGSFSYPQRMRPKDADDDNGVEMADGLADLHLDPRPSLSSGVFADVEPETDAEAASGPEGEPEGEPEVRRPAAHVALHRSRTFAVRGPVTPEFQECMDEVTVRPCSADGRLQPSQTSLDHRYTPDRHQGTMTPQLRPSITSGYDGDDECKQKKDDRIVSRVRRDPSQCSTKVSPTVRTGSQWPDEGCTVRYARHPPVATSAEDGGPDPGTGSLTTNDEPSPSRPALSVPVDDRVQRGDSSCGGDAGTLPTPRTGSALTRSLSRLNLRLSKETALGLVAAAQALYLVTRPHASGRPTRQMDLRVPFALTTAMPVAVLGHFLGRRLFGFSVPPAQLGDASRWRHTYPGNAAAGFIEYSVAGVLFAIAVVAMNALANWLTAFPRLDSVPFYPSGVSFVD